MKIIYVILTALFMGTALDMSAQNYLEQFTQSFGSAKFVYKPVSNKVKRLVNCPKGAITIKNTTPFSDLTDLGEGFWIDEAVFQMYPTRDKYSLIIGKAYKYQRANFVAQLSDFDYLFAEQSDMVGK